MPQERWRNLTGALSLGVDAFLANASAEVSWAREPDNAPQNLHALADRFAPAKWQAPVIVAVDEAQRLSGPKHAQYAMFLQGIHDASADLPLSLVLAGLGDTRDAAHEMDLTRGTTIHEIDGLGATRRDRDADAGLLPAFRHRPPTATRRVLDALAAPCEGWPRHLHFATQALAEEALRREGDLGRVDWDRIGTEAEESRTRYYQHQQSTAMREADGLTAAVLSRLTPDTKLSGALGLIEGLAVDQPGHRLPEGMTAKGFYTHLVHRGALQERADRTIHSPIPSFRTYLVRAGGLKAYARTDTDESPLSKLPDPSPIDDPADTYKM